MHTICTLSQKWSARPGLTILITTCSDSTYPSAPPGTRTPNLLIKSQLVLRYTSCPYLKGFCLYILVNTRLFSFASYKVIVDY